MTAWTRRERRAGGGAAVVVVLLLLIGVVSYYFTGARLNSGIRSLIPDPPGGAASSGLGGLASMIQDFTSQLALYLPGVHVGEDNVTSNWAGYVAMAERESATYVNGTWTVPTLTCTSTSRTGVLFWVGLGGISPLPLEQIGTTAFCLNGQAVYDSWYEAVPSENHIIILNQTNVSPGERVVASLNYSNSTNRFTYQIGVAGQAPETFSQTYANVTAPMSAEWVVEAPFTPFGAVPMANFGSVSFQGSATLGGQTGGPAVFTKSTSAYVLRSSYLCNDHSDKAIPGKLLDSGGFDVTWENGNC